MTKTIRIENADMNSHDKVRVITQVKDAEGNWVDSLNEPPVNLANPCQLQTFGIWSQKRVIVEEYNDPPAVVSPLHHPV